VLTISFDPREKPELAALKKRQYRHQYARRSAAGGWHFLTGDEPSIRRVTQAAGFNYKYDTKFDQYVHASGILVLTPQGKISRYFFGLDYAPRDLRLALAEASGGKVGSFTDAILLFCYHYDPDAKKYTLAVTNLVRAGGVVTLAALGAFLFFSVRSERRKAAAAPAPARETLKSP